MVENPYKGTEYQAESEGWQVCYNAMQPEIERLEALVKELEDKAEKPSDGWEKLDKWEQAILAEARRSAIRKDAEDRGQ